MTKLEDLVIILPCGFKTGYKEIFSSVHRFPCPVCKTHLITTDECLNMTRNELVIGRAKLFLDQENLKEAMKNFQIFKNDPKYFVDESYDQLKNEIDLRREEVKLIMNNKIDDYYEGLIKEIDEQKKLKLDEFRKDLETIKSLEKMTNNITINEDLDIDMKLRVIENNSLIIKYVRNLIETAASNLTKKNLQFKPSSINLDINDLMTWQEETKFVATNKKISNDREEAIFQLVISDFYKFTHCKNVKIFSKVCLVKNLEWIIKAELFKENENKYLSLYLICDSLFDSKNILPVNAKVEFRLMHKSESEKLFDISFEHFYSHSNIECGTSKFMDLSEITSSDNDYYNFEEDCITIEVWLKIDASQDCEKMESLKNKRIAGIVKWFNASLGYGFIARNDNSEEIFVHFSAIGESIIDSFEKNLVEGEEVEFDIVMGRKGKEAANVTGPNGQPVKGLLYEIMKSVKFESDIEEEEKVQENSIHSDYD